MGKFGWAYIGCGSIAHTTAKELIKTHENQIVAVWNRTRSKAEKFARKFGGKAYDTAEEAINAPGVEGVYIALNGDRHAEYTKLCINSKKPVLCEKPFTVNATEAKEVFDYAAEEGVYVSEAMWTWHNKTALQVKKWLQSGVIGEIQSVECAYAYPMLKFSKNPRLTTPAMLGGALLDIGIYAVRYCYELFGMPEKVSCKGDMHAVDYGEKIIFYYPGFTVRMRISMTENVGEFFTIKGTKGSISVPRFHMAKKALLQTDKKQIEKNQTLLYGTQFTNVANEIRAGRTSGEKVTAKSTIEVMQLLDECRRQMGLVYPMERIVQTGEKVGLNAKIRMISHLGFNCKNLQKTMDFYCNILGAKEKFYLTYGDIADDKAKEAKEAGQPEPGFVKSLRRFNDRKWSVYLEWADSSFIELFDQMGAFRKRVPKGHDLNYTHFSLEVENIREFRQMVIDRGGAEYLDTEIAPGMECTLQMWMHDPEGNKFEIMEYTSESYQIVGRHGR